MLRPLGPQVESFRHTVNPRDPVLRKYVGLSRYFNPTGLGQDRSVSEALNRHYRLIQPYQMNPGVTEHSFPWYIAQPEFRQMLCDAEIARSPCRVSSGSAGSP